MEIKIKPGQLFIMALEIEKILSHQESSRVLLKRKQALGLGVAMFSDKVYIVARIGKLLWIMQVKKKIIRSFSSAESILIKLLSIKFRSIIQIEKKISKNAIQTKKMSQTKTILWKTTGMLRMLGTLYLIGLSWKMEIEVNIGSFWKQIPN